MKQISSFDLYYLIREMQELVGSRLDTFYFHNNTFQIRLYQKFKGQFFIISNMGKSIFFDTKREDGSTNNPFVSFLRKTISNSYIVSVEQINFERIIKITLNKKENNEIRNYYLYLELFAPGNVILTQEDNKIINLLFRKNFRDRILKIKGDYILPPKKEIDVLKLDLSLLEESFNNSDLDIVRFLATKLGLGGKFAEEIVLRAGLNIESKNFVNLIKVINELLNEKINSRIVVNNKEEIVDFLPFEFKSFKDKTNREISTFNLAIKTYYDSNKEEKDQREIQFSLEVKKLQNRLLKQERMLEEVEKSYEENNEIGNKIYENYAEIEKLLKLVKSDVSKAEKHRLVKNIDSKKNEIIVEV